jgi:hypothetical protein
MEEVFDSSFDGWPAVDIPRASIVEWLAGLPAGEARAEPGRVAADPDNPFATQPTAPGKQAEARPSINPFLAERRTGPAANPFLDTERDRRRDEALRRLKDEQD